MISTRCTAGSLRLTTDDGAKSTVNCMSAKIKDSTTTAWSESAPNCESMQTRERWECTADGRHFDVERRTSTPAVGVEAEFVLQQRRLFCYEALALSDVESEPLQDTIGLMSVRLSSDDDDDDVVANKGSTENKASVDEPSRLRTSISRQSA